MDRITTLTAFVAVVDSGSFTAAARQLKLSPATITTQIRSLEDRLGVRLLNRTTRTLNITEVGQEFYARSVRILAAVEEAESAATALHSSVNGTLRLNISPELANYGANLIRDYAAVHPQTAFELTTIGGELNLVGGNIDVAIWGGPLPDSQLVACRIGYLAPVVCASPQYLQRHGMPELPDDLVEHNCLVSPRFLSGDEWRFAEGATLHAVRVSGHLRSNSIEALRVAVLSGQGVALLPELTVHGDLAAGLIVPLLPRFQPEPAAIHAVYPTRRHLSAKVRNFLDFLIKRSRTERNIDQTSCHATGCGIIGTNGLTAASSPTTEHVAARAPAWHARSKDRGAPHQPSSRPQHSSDRNRQGRGFALCHSS